MPFRSVSSLLFSLLTIVNEGSSLTMVNEGSSLTIVNEGLSLTIVNETTNFLKRSFWKRPFFKTISIKKRSFRFSFFLNSASEVLKSELLCFKFRDQLFLLRSMKYVIFKIFKMFNQLEEAHKSSLGQW